MKSISLKDIEALFPEERFVIDKSSQVINGASSLHQVIITASPTKVSWVHDKNIDTIDPTKLSVGLLVLTPVSYEKLKLANCNFLLVNNPRSIFFKIVKQFFPSSKKPAGVEKSAFIHPTSHIGKNCYIGHGVIIEEHCFIDEHTTIMHNTCILAGTKIGKDVIIGCNNTIGNYGFGYEKDEAGNYELLEHVGNVIIHDGVEIHNNTCIDRGVLNSTEIFENVKIDNLVHIAHGVTIERNSLVIANAMIAGSTRIGENSWIAPSVSIKNKLKIAPNTFTGIGATVLKDTKENETYIGNPAITLDEHKRWSEIKKKLY
jgi:UDP-3-O-[3-hydroxymyristoyl] glucosamine N-acyltransferase